MAARVLGRIGVAGIGRPALQARSLASIGRARAGQVSSLQRTFFDRRSHARVHKALYHSSAPVRGTTKTYTAELSPAAARVPTVPGVHPNSGGYQLPHNPPDRPVMSTAVYITACSVEDKPNELFPDPGSNWYRTLNSLTGLKGIAHQNYLAGYFRNAWGYHKDAGMIGIARNRSPYIWPCAMWAAVIVVSKELMVIDAEWLAVPFYWFTWWTVATFVIEFQSLKTPRKERSLNRRQKLTETMYTVKELIQTHHDFIGFVRGLPNMVSDLADLVEAKQVAERNTKHFQIKQFVESFLDSKLRQQQAAHAARQSRFEQEAPEYVAKLLQDPSVKDRILDSTIEMVISGGKQKINPVKAAYLSYIKTVREAALSEAKAAEAARPAIERAVAKSRAARANTRHQLAQKLKAEGGPDLTPFSPAVKAEPLTEAEEAIIAKNRAANAEQRSQWLLRLHSLIPVRHNAVKS